MKLWKSGIIFSILTFVTGLGNFAFHAMITKPLGTEWGYVVTTLGLIGLLSLPLSIVSTALVHYIAHFRACNDEARLQGLLSGCPKFLFKVTIAGSILAVLLAEPLGRFFHFEPSLLLAALICVLLTAWQNFANALCQGMGWFKRLALIGMAVVVLRLLFAYVMTHLYPYAEVAIYAGGFAVLANLALLYWRKDLFKGGEQISPWNKEFAGYLLVTGAVSVGGYLFLYGDLLVAQRYFGKNLLDNYGAAGVLGRALPSVAAPLLTVLFTSRSASKMGGAITDQRILLSLYAAGLTLGAAVLFVLKGLFLRILHQSPVEAGGMVNRFTVVMIFVGLSQAISTWCLASRWLKLSLLYGGLGLVYWLVLLAIGKTPDQLLMAMIIGAAVTFVILCSGLFLTLRQTSQKTA